MAKSKRTDGGRRWALQDAKNRLSEVVRAAERGEPQVVTRRGIDTAVIISHDDFERLSRGSAAGDGSLAASLLAMPSSAQAPEFERIDVASRGFDG